MVFHRMAGTALEQYLGFFGIPKPPVRFPPLSAAQTLPFALLRFLSSPLSLCLSLAHSFFLSLLFSLSFYLVLSHCCARFRPCSLSLSRLFFPSVSHSLSLARSPANTSSAMTSSSRQPILTSAWTRVLVAPSRTLSLHPPQMRACPLTCAFARAPLPSLAICFVPCTHAHTHTNSWHS